MHVACIHTHLSCLTSGASAVASFPGPAQLSVAMLYCKQWKAGRGLGLRLQYIVL